MMGRVTVDERGFTIDKEGPLSMPFHNDDLRSHVANLCACCHRRGPCFLCDRWRAAVGLSVPETGGAE